jgi:hypothetical protein
MGSYRNRNEDEENGKNGIFIHQLDLMINTQYGNSIVIK